MKAQKVRVGISIGDVNGIGMEVILKTFSDPRMMDFVTPLIYGSSRILNYHKKAIELDEFDFHLIKDAGEAKEGQVNVVNLWEEEVNIELGQPSASSGDLAVQSLEAATGDLIEQKVQALVTAPVHKKSIQSSSFQFPGHTEYLASKAGDKNPLMIMVNDDFRVGVVTGHIPLKDVSNALAEELLSGKIKAFHQSLLKDFGIRGARLALLGLNPHAGEEGMLGSEEKEVLNPVIRQFREQGQVVLGPYPADGFFGSGEYARFDGVLAMYHDQGLIPFKALSFNKGVNFTAGLPFVRTSPDHGTAFEIAGEGVASADSFRNAVFTARKIILNRQQFDEITENPLQPESGNRMPHRQ